MDKVVASVAEAVADIGSESSLAVGGFGLCGIPSALIQALFETGVDNLDVVSGRHHWPLIQRSTTGSCTSGHLVRSP